MGAVYQPAGPVKGVYHTEGCSTVRGSRNPFRPLWPALLSANNWSIICMRYMHKSQVYRFVTFDKGVHLCNQDQYIQYFC